ncbi:GDYXXLXY domain-containing protein [Lutimaribacter sp. EGI FJ00015]|uniref:GDYXXLXY domain-containing protein n=1 Tax=Lutimaribacter degradans TaxID=2945989 RepID=A0ACC5ZYT0_9RHOB|nr:GDYXXLXY domain-containing protein [Lutimaribacter sp. EGI FJ00013]MCM2563501.1 GDYXXLXY domain-containing protein [Lutimaribacter sp. EGI FJ00013]MCO0614681.1 GDYXXLXY domain-containing protein [Lutimaribacter sp. EGI FJ00015]MCO0637351.1 GDYXXLXY domain-containing protein [Lutimaribacter sp. EGI FJ00014]
MIRLSRKMILPAALLAALFQTGTVGKMVVERNTLLREGTEVWLETGFVDPRDLFRGHYVTLRLAISQIEKANVEAAELPGPGQPVWAELAQGENRFWQVTRLHAAPPDAPQSPVLRGTLTGSHGDSYWIDFPVDRYFAPKAEALEFEALRQDGKLGVVLALAPDGSAAIKGLTMAGDVIYSEPLY